MQLIACYVFVGEIMPKKNLFYNIIYQIFVLVMPLITAPYISRIFGPDGVGQYSFNYSIATYFVYFCLLGINNYGVRSIAKCKTAEEKEQTFSDVYFVQFIISITVFVLYLLYIAFISKDNFVYAICFIPYVISGMLDINWFFFGTEKFLVTTLRNCIVKTLTVIAIFVLIKTKDHLFLYCLIMSLAYLLTQIIMWFSLFRIIKVKKPRCVYFFSHLKGMLVLFIPVIAVSLYRIMDKVMLGIFSTKTELGFYECAEQIIGVPATLATAFGTTMLPRMTNLLAKGDNKSFDNLFRKSIFLAEFLCFPMAFGILSISSTFMPLYYGELFSSSAETLNILCLSFIFSCLASIVRTQFLVPQSKDKIYIISVICGALINVVLNIIFIPIYGANGAAIGTVGANFIVALYQYVATYKIYRNIICIKNGLVFLPCAALMFLIISFSNRIIIINNSMIMLLFDVLIGVISYCIIAMPIYFILEKKNERN